MQMMLKHIFLSITYCSSLYVTSVSSIQSVILSQICGRGHFRSRDNDGGHTIPSAVRAVAKNSMLYSNLTTVYIL